MSLISVSGSSAVVKNVTAEKTLMDYLLSPHKYNRLLRPMSEQVNVNFHLVLSQLIGLVRHELNYNDIGLGF